MSVQLAVAPIAWSNSDLPQLGGHTLETCLRESREAGLHWNRKWCKISDGSRKA